MHVLKQTSLGKFTAQKKCVQIKNVPKFYDHFKNMGREKTYGVKKDGSE